MSETSSLSAPFAPTGHVAAGFEPVRDAFIAHMSAGPEIAAAFAVQVHGRTVVDLRAGPTAPGGDTAFSDTTLTQMFSCSKIVASVVVALLVDRGVLSYETPLSALWPDFAQAGKAGVTLEQALSHQAGLPGLAEDWSPEAWLDWDATCARLAREAPMWPLGEGSGYHPITWGYLVGETVRRAAGRSVGEILRADICAPAAHGGPAPLDVWLGLPEAEHARVATLQLPKRLPDFGELNAQTRAAFLTKWYAPGRRLQAPWLVMGTPSAAGVATAPALASAVQPLARAGKLGARQLISPATIDKALAERVTGPDRVVPFDVSFAAGFYRNKGGAFGPGPNAVGHAGFGGSAVIADPDRGLTAAYLMTRQDGTLMPDQRALGLIKTAYACLSTT